MIQCIVVKKIILYAETIDYFFGRVVFLRKDLVEAIGTKKAFILSYWDSWVIKNMVR